MKNAEKTEEPLEVEAIPVRVRPETVEKLQADVIALEEDASDKQKTIDKLQLDISALTGRVEVLEATIIP